MMNRGGGDSGNLLMSLIPNDCPKPDLFLHSKGPDNSIDVTNYTIDDFAILYKQEDNELIINCLYESSDLNPAIINDIIFGIDNSIYFTILNVSGDNIETNEVSYNNKTYYYYYKYS